MNDRFLTMIGAIPEVRRPVCGERRAWRRFQRAIGARPVLEQSAEQRAAQRRAFLRAIGAQPVVRKGDPAPKSQPAASEIARDDKTA
jgi:hypothetical protein